MAKIKLRYSEKEPKRDHYRFICPGCKDIHGFAVPAWTFDGNFDQPTIGGSVLVNRNLDCPDVPRCHSTITKGMIQFLPDCTHELAGKTVELPEID